MKKKTIEKQAPGDGLLKCCAQALGISKKILKRAVREVKLRAVAERIAREEIESKWGEILDRTKRAE
jgi:hypothetical protein